MHAPYHNSTAQLDCKLHGVGRQTGARRRVDLARGLHWSGATLSCEAKFPSIMTSAMADAVTRASEPAVAAAAFPGLGPSRNRAPGSSPGAGNSSVRCRR